MPAILRAEFQCPRLFIPLASNSSKVVSEVRSVVLSRSSLSAVMAALRYAKRAHHRVMVVLVGDNDGNLVMGTVELLNAYFRSLGSSEETLLYVYHAFYEDGCARREMFERVFKAPCNVLYVSYHESVKLLGRTFDIAVVDLLNNLEPNDLGKLSGIVDGGGFYVLMMPSFERLMRMITRFQGMLLTPQYGPEHLRRYFERRFVTKLYEHDGILIYDVDERKLLKEAELPRVGRAYARPLLEIPEKRLFPESLYKLALTKDQINVLKLLENLYERPERGAKKVIIITADRGRGKSSAIGMGIAGLSHKIRRAKGRCRVIVTAPSEANVQEIFKFVKRGLERLNYSVEVEERGELVVGIRAKGVSVEYFTPLEAVTHRGDILAVDEAASLHVPMLFALLKRYDRVVYSSTIHGYEGAGRGFSVRFLRRLRRLRNVEVYEYEMEEPIRYAASDPVEKWAFDTLLLDAEPAVLDARDLECARSMEVEYFIPDPEEFFLKSERELREFFGIYIMAHYRNNPNDLGMMMDAPHHFVRALKLKTGKIVVSLELAEEGPLDEHLARESSKGAWIMGNIIPDRLIKHYKLVDFGRFRGIRIVRIATHPELWGRGLGSQALKEVEREASEAGYDWVGAGFGITYELLNFWLKNSYIPVHLSPERNPVSGEYSVLVVKPLKREVARYIDVIAWEFKKRLLYSLAEPYHDLSPRVVRALLHHTPKREVKPRLSVYQLGRLVSYAWGEMTLENCMDCVGELARAYFMSGCDYLSEEQELLLITRVLQAKSWRVTCSELGMPPPRAMEELRRAARKACSKFFNIEDEDEAEKYLYLTLDRDW